MGFCTAEELPVYIIHSRRRGRSSRTPGDVDDILDDVKYAAVLVIHDGVYKQELPAMTQRTIRIPTLNEFGLTSTSGPACFGCLVLHQPAGIHNTTSDDG